MDLEVEAKPLKLDIEGQTTLIGAGKTHINWKSGVYCDDSGSKRQLTQDQLESLRYVFGGIQSGYGFFVSLLTRVYSLRTQPREKPNAR